METPMKILLASSDNPYIEQIGGKHIHLLLLEKGIRELGHECAVIYPETQGYSKCLKYMKYFLSGLKEGDFRNFFPLQKLQVVFLIREMEKLFRNIDREEYTIIHFHDVISLCAYLKSVPVPEFPVILTLHGYFAREALDYSGLTNVRMKNKFFRFCAEIESKAIDSVQHVIAVDNRIKTYAIKTFGIPENNISVIFNAIDTDQFAPVSRFQKDCERMHHSYVKENVIILVPRRLVPKNGVKYAIKAIQNLDADHVKLLIAGSGPMEKELRSLSGTDKRIEFLGNINHEEIGEYYTLSDIVIIPSVTSHDIQEATSLSMLEGMACGKIVICSDIGGMSEVVKHGINGFLVKEKSSEEIQKIILQYLSGAFDSVKIAANAREYVVQFHSYTSHSQKIIELYRTLGTVMQ